MRKVIIDGMKSQENEFEVLKTLNSLDSVVSSVSYKTGIAKVKGDVSDEIIKNAIAKLGYTVCDIVRDYN